MTLYSYFRSSAAYRVRIAFNLKGLGFQTVPIHLQKDGGLNRKPAYRAINPLMRVPTLQAFSALGRPFAAAAVAARSGRAGAGAGAGTHRRVRHPPAQ